MGPRERLRYWAEQALSTKSLLAAGAAAAGLVGWATTHNPAFGWLMLGGAGAWTALMYYLGATGQGDHLLVPQRGQRGEGGGGRPARASPCPATKKPGRSG